MHRNNFVVSFFYKYPPIQRCRFTPKNTNHYILYTMYKLFIQISTNYLYKKSTNYLYKKVQIIYTTKVQSIYTKKVQSIYTNK